VYDDAVQVIVPNASKGDKSNKRGAFLVSGRSAKESKAAVNFVNMTDDNYLIGHDVAQNITSGKRNAIIGYEAAKVLTTGWDNVIMGYQAGYSLSSGEDNTYIGNGAGAANIDGDHNICFGTGAGIFNENGDENIFMGNWAGGGNDAGSDNVIIGHVSGTNNDGSCNTFLGNASGYNTDGSGNVFLGYKAGYQETGSYKLYIDNSDTIKPLIYGDFSTDNLIFNASVFMPSVYGDAISGTYRDLYIKDDGQLGYISSSKRYKKNITDMEDVSWIYKLRPVNYLYKEDLTNSKSYGLIAEEVEEINMHFVSYNNKGKPETVLYSQLISPMLKAIQEQQKQLEAKGKEIEQLKEENQKQNIRLQLIEEYMKEQKDLGMK